MKRQYEDTTQAERLEQHTAQSLTVGWTLWNSTDPIIVNTRLLWSASFVGSVTAFINLLGNPPLLIMMFVLAQAGAIAWFIWQYPGRFHRISFVSALWLGFCFAMNWSLVTGMVTSWL